MWGCYICTQQWHLNKHWAYIPWLMLQKNDGQIATIIFWSLTMWFCVWSRRIFTFTLAILILSSKMGSMTTLMFIKSFCPKHMVKLEFNRFPSAVNWTLIIKHQIAVQFSRKLSFLVIIKRWCLVNVDMHLLTLM